MNKTCVRSDGKEMVFKVKAGDRSLSKKNIQNLSCWNTLLNLFLAHPPLSSQSEPHVNTCSSRLCVFDYLPLKHAGLLIGLPEINVLSLTNLFLASDVEKNFQIFSLLPSRGRGFLSELHQ